VEAGLDVQLEIGSAARPRFQNGEWRTHERWRGDKASSEDAEARAKAAFGEVAGEGTFPRTPCGRTAVARDNPPFLLWVPTPLMSSSQKRGYTIRGDDGTRGGNIAARRTGGRECGSRKRGGRRATSERGRVRGRTVHQRPECTFFCKDGRKDRVHGFKKSKTKKPSTRIIYNHFGLFYNRF
jgi:hypothetical protein